MMPWTSPAETNRESKDAAGRPREGRKDKSLDNLPGSSGIPNITEIKAANLKLGGGLNRISTLCQEDPTAPVRERLLMNQQRRLKKQRDPLESSSITASDDANQVITLKSKAPKAVIIAEPRPHITIAHNEYADQEDPPRRPDRYSEPDQNDGGLPNAQSSRQSAESSARRPLFDNQVSQKTFNLPPSFHFLKRDENRESSKNSSAAVSPPTMSLRELKLKAKSDAILKTIPKMRRT